MKATDFLFDDHYLSEFKCIICKFGDDGEETSSNGSNIEFTSVNPAASPFWHHYSTKYAEPITPNPIQICKLNCEDINDSVFSPTEISNIMRWLNREDGYHKFKLVGDDYFYMAQINVSQVVINGDCVGFELTLKTDAPFAYVEQDDIEFEIDSSNDYTITDTSDRIGYVYPTFEITVLEEGTNDLTLINSQDHSRPLVIKDCIQGEVIKLNGKYMVCTTSSTVDLSKRFNYRYPKIMNTYTDRDNIFYSSIGISVVVKWNPLKKISIC